MCSAEGHNRPFVLQLRQETEGIEKHGGSVEGGEALLLLLCVTGGWHAVLTCVCVCVCVWFKVTSVHNLLFHPESSSSLFGRSLCCVYVACCDLSVVDSLTEKPVVVALCPCLVSYLCCALCGVRRRACAACRCTVRSVCLASLCQRVCVCVCLCAMRVPCSVCPPSLAVKQPSLSPAPVRSERRRTAPGRPGPLSGSGEEPQCAPG